MNALRAIRVAIKKVELPLYFLTAIFAIYLAAANILRAAKWPSEATWAVGTVWFWLIVGTAVYVPIYALYKALDAYFEKADKEAAEVEEKEAILDRDLELICQRVVAEVAGQCQGVDVNELAAHVWICKEDETFDRRAFFFLPEQRKRSGIRWRKGKGIAGTAWKINQDLRADLKPLRARVRQLGDEGFDRLPEEERYGMTANEMKATNEYSGICAIRLFSQENNAMSLLGLFVLDYVGSNAFPCVAEASASRHVTSLLGASEKILTEAKGILEA